MKIGFIGLGKMGLNMVKKLKDDHELIVFDVDNKALQKAQENGIESANSMKVLTQKLDGSKIIWLMVPSGKITNETILELSKFLKEDDIIIDGGNSHYKNSIENYNLLKNKKISFLDIGTSGGIFGFENGYNLMVGGDKKIYEKIIPLLKTLSKENSFEYMGKSGSGHFVKMIHNAIEYGVMQAYAEGFELLKEKKEFDLDLKKISKLWNKNSVIRSWLLTLLEDVFDDNFEKISGYVEDSGEGRWAVKEAIDQNISVPVLAISLFERFSSRKKDMFRNKILSSLRNKFGGHKTF